MVNTEGRDFPAFLVDQPWVESADHPNYNLTITVVGIWGSTLCGICFELSSC